MKKASWHMPGGLFHAPMFRGTQKNRPPRFRLTHDARILPASMSSRPDHGCRLAEPVLPVSSTGCSCATTVNPMLHSPGRCKPRKCRKPASGGGSRPSEKAGETPDPPADSFRLAAARLSRRAGGTLYAPPGQETPTRRRTFRAGLSGLRPALPSLRIRPAEGRRTPWRPSPRTHRSRACGRYGGTPRAYDGHHVQREC